MPFYCGVPHIQGTSQGAKVPWSPRFPENPILICIPGRWAASRFPGKLGRPAGAGTVFEKACATALDADLGPVIAVVDDVRLQQLAERAGARCVRVDDDVASGWARIALAHRRGLLGSASPDDLLVNLQADAIGATTACLRGAVEALATPGVTLGTVAVPTPRALAGGRTTVALAGPRALYFSRHPLPADRDADSAPVLVHIGVYAARAADLQRVLALPEGPLERAERLEQLRWLEHGESIGVQVIEGPLSLGASVDRPGDLNR